MNIGRIIFGPPRPAGPWDAFRSKGEPAPEKSCEHVFDELRTGVRIFDGWIVEPRCIHCRIRAATRQQADEAKNRAIRRENERLEAVGG